MDYRTFFSHYRNRSFQLLPTIVVLAIVLLASLGHQNCCDAARRSSSSSSSSSSSTNAATTNDNGNKPDGAKISESTISHNSQNGPHTESMIADVHKDDNLVEKLEKKLEKKLIPEIKTNHEVQSFIIGPHHQHRSDHRQHQNQPQHQHQRYHHRPDHIQVRTHSEPIIIEETEEIELDPHNHHDGHYDHHEEEHHHHPEEFHGPVHYHEEHHHPGMGHTEYHHPHPIHLKPHDEILIPLRQQSKSHHQQQQSQSSGQIAHLKIEQPNSQIMLHVVPPGDRRRYDSNIPDLLAILAPLAAIPLLGSLAVSSFTTMLTLTGLGRRRRRRRRDLSLHNTVLSQLQQTALNQNLSRPFDSFNLAPHQAGFNRPKTGISNLNGTHHNPQGSFAQDLPLFEELNSASNKNKTLSPISELFQLDVVQQYLRQSGRPDHNDQIIASYLGCRGMFTSTNHCLERLACHYADIQDGRLRPLERDVAALIIYSLLRNNHIDSSFKRRLQRAALFGYDHQSEDQPRSKSSSGASTTTTPATDYEASFVPVCDRQFPCPKSEMP